MSEKGKIRIFSISCEFYKITLCSKDTILPWSNCCKMNKLQDCSLRTELSGVWILLLFLKLLPGKTANPWTYLSEVRAAWGPSPGTPRLPVPPGMPGGAWEEWVHPQPSAPLIRRVSSSSAAGGGDGGPRELPTTVAQAVTPGVPSHECCSPQWQPIPIEPLERPAQGWVWLETRAGQSGLQWFLSLPRGLCRGLPKRGPGVKITLPLARILWPYHLPPGEVKSWRVLTPQALWHNPQDPTILILIICRAEKKWRVVKK